ncbi:MAG: PIN domain-containing protein [Thermodesulfovibrionales bacterium]
MKRPENSLPDTNTIIRYLMRDDESLYVKAKEFFDKVKNGTTKAIIMESVIAECIYILTKIYKVPKSAASEKVVNILHYKGIANDDQKELIHALTLFSERNIDIVDCILCIKAVPAEVHLLSFDDDLNKINASLRHQTV